MRSGNPALSDRVFRDVYARGTAEAMTIEGTVNKTLLAFGILLLTSVWVWSQTVTTKTVPLGLMSLGIFGGLITALVTAFKKEWAPVTTPIYAGLEGLALGAISAVFEAQYPGIVIQAVGLTFATLFSLLMAYKSRLIQVTDNFRMGVVAATGAVFLVYFLNILLGFFGIRMPFLHDAGPIGIGISLVIVGIAALNLVLDFDFIEQMADQGVPKYMEWYGAFGLMVTLIWLYLEILRLLAKLRNNR